MGSSVAVNWQCVQIGACNHIRIPRPCRSPKPARSASRAAPAPPRVPAALKHQSQPGCLSAKPPDTGGEIRKVRKQSDLRA